MDNIIRYDLYSETKDNITYSQWIPIYENGTPLTDKKLKKFDRDFARACKEFEKTYLAVERLSKFIVWIAKILSKVTVKFK